MGAEGRRHVHTAEQQEQEVKRKELIKVAIFLSRRELSLALAVRVMSNEASAWAVEFGQYLCATVKPLRLCRCTLPPL